MLGQIDIRETIRQQKMLRRRKDIEERLQKQREERNHYLEMVSHSGEYSEDEVCMAEEDQEWRQYKIWMKIVIWKRN